MEIIRLVWKTVGSVMEILIVGIRVMKMDVIEVSCYKNNKPYIHIDVIKVNFYKKKQHIRISDI